MSVVGGINVPECLTNWKAIRFYVNEMKRFNEKADRFYSAHANDPLGAPIGRFCLGGAESAALNTALSIQNPRPIKTVSPENLHRIFYRESSAE